MDNRKSDTIAIILAVAFLLKIFLTEEMAEGVFFGFLSIWLLISVVKEWRNRDVD